MTIEIRTDDLFDSGAQMLVNPVNCVGVMGAGLAKQFKQRYPGMFARYQVLCRNGRLQPGSVLLDNGDGQQIACVPTKVHWRDPSRIEWVVSGVKALARKADEGAVESLATPALGCGLGGLEIVRVLPRMAVILGPLETRVMFYVPHPYRDWAREVCRPWK